MSHLIIEQGKEVGREITVPPTGMKFGSSSANDLVIQDDAAMLFHGRFFFKSGGTLWVTDFGAGKKVMVGGVPIDEHQLNVGDLVEVGGTAFRIINTGIERLADTSSQTAALDQAGGKEIDLGFKPVRKLRTTGAVKERSRSASLIHRILQVAVIFLVLLVLVVAVPELLKLKTQGHPVSLQEKSLSFSYECVHGSLKNIFRYHLELGADGKASLQIDDLQNRHITKSAMVPADVLENLSRRIAGTGFFDLEGDREVEARNRYELYDIAIFRNGNFNHVRVLNRDPPSELRQTISILEDFMFGQMDVPFTLLEDPEALIGHAEESFKLGESRFAERDVQPGNLAESIKHYKETLVYLETLEPKPSLYRQAMQKMEMAKAEQDARYKDYMFNVDRAMRLGDWREASKHLRILAELIPDRSDDRYETISSKQLEVEDHLR
ncbi:MAG: FHA domain-containing protein [Kiritimatiellales bacterium]|nr:FHA domain-containing protein [Kiritimatiellales bacterium]MCF7863527.1 FHA domain-containing protein [Kiritimatiellales bacterium]